MGLLVLVQFAGPVVPLVLLLPVAAGSHQGLPEAAPAANAPAQARP